MQELCILYVYQNKEDLSNFISKKLSENHLNTYKAKDRKLLVIVGDIKEVYYTHNYKTQDINNLMGLVLDGVVFASGQYEGEDIMRILTRVRYPNVRKLK